MRATLDRLVIAAVTPGCNWLRVLPSRVRRSPPEMRFINGTVMQRLLAPALAPNLDWLTGGAFGLEASVLGLANLIALTVFLFR